MGKSWAMALLLATAAAVAAEPPPAQPLHWLVADFGPAVIRDGPLRGRGYVDRLLAEVLQPALADRRQRISYGPTARVLRELIDDPLACSPALAKNPDRLDTLLFSKPLMRFLPAGLILRRSQLPALQPLIDAQGRLSLSRYLDQPQRFRLGVMGQRAHGVRIDTLLRQHPQQLLAINFNNASQALISMVALGRDIEATLGYSFELEYQARSRPALAAALVWLPLAEQPPSLLGYAACARSAAGAQAIAVIDRWLDQPGHRDQSQRILEEWLDPASAERLRRLRREAPEQFWQEDGG